MITRPRSPDQGGSRPQRPLDRRSGSQIGVEIGILQRPSADIENWRSWLSGGVRPDRHQRRPGADRHCLTVEVVAHVRARAGAGRRGSPTSQADGRDRLNPPSIIRAANLKRA